LVKKRFIRKYFLDNHILSHNFAQTLSGINPNKKIMRTSITIILILLANFTVCHAQPPKPLMPPMIHVEGGTFMMGNHKGNMDEQPVHKVSLNSFYMGKYEVTFSDFKKFVEATGYISESEKPDSANFKSNLAPRTVYTGSWKKYPDGRDVPPSDSMKPVTNISWNDANAYLAWLSKATGKQFRLPTEAEWEFAARGGNKSRGHAYAGSAILDDVAWYMDNSGKQMHTIGTKLPNELGIYDMSGNVREWCSDWYGELYYKVSPELNPSGPETGTGRVLRGRAWGNDAKTMRLTYRNYAFPYNSAVDFGFRPAMVDEEAVKKASEPVKQEENSVMKDFGSKGFVDVYGINFDIGKAKVKAESLPVIAQIVKYMHENPSLRIMIEGHTDSQGNDNANQVLSENRAKAIKAELVKGGISVDRLETVGYGETKPIADNNTRDGRTQNRRVTIKKL
jgi:formylglycine-generating enzyme required for sulfatase activity